MDLFLIHWPVRLKQGVKGLNFTGEDVLPFHIKGTSEAMEECCKLGLAKPIGFSNFGTIKLSELLENGTIPPAVNQVKLIHFHEVVNYKNGDGTDANWLVLGGNEPIVAAGRTQTILQREGNPYQCMVTIRSIQSLMGFKCSDGEPNPCGNGCCQTDDRCSGSLLFVSPQYLRD